MQTLTVDFICSLDGYGAAEGWPGWWGMESPEYLQWLDELPDFSFEDRLRIAAYTCCEHRDSGRHGFEYRIRDSLVTRRQHEKISP